MAHPILGKSLYSFPDGSTLKRVHEDLKGLPKGAEQSFGTEKRVACEPSLGEQKPLPVTHDEISALRAEVLQAISELSAHLSEEFSRQCTQQSSYFAEELSRQCSDQSKFFTEELSRQHSDQSEYFTDEFARQCSKLIIPLETRMQDIQSLQKQNFTDLSAGQQDLQTIVMQTTLTLQATGSHKIPGSPANSASRMGVLPDGDGNADIIVGDHQVERWYSYNIGSAASFMDSGTQARLIEFLNRWSIVIVVLNSVYIGFEADVLMTTAARQELQPFWVFWVSLAFTMTFLVELFIRFLLERRRFFLSGWNLFETMLVITAFLETIWGLRVVMILRILRAMQAARLLKPLTRRIKTLRIIFRCIGSSIASLFWMFVVTFVAVWVFAILVMQIVQSHLVDDPSLEQRDVLLRNYGSVRTSTMTLFMSISGGIGWREVAKPLWELNRVYVLFFMMFVLLVGFGLLNIWTAVFVHIIHLEGKEDHRKSQWMAAHSDRKIVDELRRIFEAFNKGESMPAKMLLTFLSSQSAMELFSLIQVDGTEAFSFFSALDFDVLDVDDFVTGIMSLRGGSKRLSVETLMLERRLYSMVETMNDDIKSLASRLPEYTAGTI